MVRDLHDAGIEVILDVVYNHTAEGNHMGPTLSMRGIDNAAYYRLVEDDQRYYMDYTGTGNSLNVRNPHTLQLIMDSLRYWVTEMHVDGFRFDLASTLAREFYDVDRLSVFFDLVQQDPVISQAKLIAEPWDVGPGGYQVGNFPPLWTEWNGKYRDTVRDFWRGEPGTLGEFASRLTGSSRPVQGRRPPPVRVDQLRDRARRVHAQRPRLVQREAQRGERRGRQRRREPQPLVELRGRGPHRRRRGARPAGPPAAQLHHHAAAVPGRADAAARRRAGPHPERQQQRLLPRTARSPGWTGRWRPRTRAWSASPPGVSALRAGHPVFRRRRFFAGRPIGRSRGTDGRTALPDIAWFTPAGEEMTEQDWDSGFGKCVTVFLNGEGITEADTRGERVTDDSFLLCLNAHYEDIEVTLPPAGVRHGLGDRGRHRGGRGAHADHRPRRGGGRPAAGRGRRGAPGARPLGARAAADGDCERDERRP